MKLSTKLNLAVFALVIGFGLSIAMLANTAMTARATQGVVDASRVALRETNAIMQTMQRLMYTTEDIGPLLDEFIERRRTANAAMEELANHPDLDRLHSDLERRMSGMRAVWASVTTGGLEDVENGVREVLEMDLPGGIEVVPGILRLRHSLEGEQLDVNVLPTLMLIERNIDHAVSVSGWFLDDTLNSVAAAASANSAAVVAYNLRLSLIVAAVVTVAAVTFVLLIARSITRRVSALEELIAAMAERNFQVHSEIAGKDELASLGRNVNRVRDAVSEFFSAVREAVGQTHELQESLGSSSEQATSALNEISKNIEGIREQFGTLDRSVSTSNEAVSSIDARVRSLAEDIETQATSINTVFSSIEEMNAGVQNVTGLSSDRQQRAERISATVSESAETVQSTNALIRSISREIDDILEIIDIINGVSEQTHLLSMNAAIESAHAGEAGKGFAVVAEEIRKLAHSTSENAGRIEQNLRGMTDKIREALEASETSTESFESIQSEVKGFADAMAEISQNMRELSQGSREVLDSTAALSEITERIRESSHLMQSGSNEIRSAMEHAAEVSTDVANGVGEIDLGAKEILESMVSTNNMSIKNREQLEHLEELLRSFRAADVSSARDASSGEAPSGTGPESTSLETGVGPRGPESAAAEVTGVREYVRG